MRDFARFSARVQESFGNKAENAREFHNLIMDASNRTYSKFSAEETQNMLREQFNAILGIDFKSATDMQRRQAWRDHGKELYSIIEDVIADRMVSGWTGNNAFFEAYVDDINLAEGDKNQFYVRDNSLLTVSKYAGDHHDIVRQKLLPGKAFSIETTPYVIKVYTDFRLFQLGKVDFAEMVDLMYKSIDQYRMAALFTSFMSVDTLLPSDMKASIAFSPTTKSDIVDVCEAVKAATGYDVTLVGTRPAMQRLQNTVSYNMWSGNMKDEQNQNGILANWEGFPCLALERVNIAGTRTSVFSAADNKKIFIMPNDPTNKMIKRVNEGDVVYFERGMDGTLQDMTVEAEIWYREGLGVVVNELFGCITDTNA